MINANELRIGNILIDPLTKSYLRVSELNDQGKIVSTVIDRRKFPLPAGWSTQPIPLTPEILEKCGFERSVLREGAEDLDEVNGYLIYQSHRYYWFDLFINKDNKVCVHYLKKALYKHPQFLHQLQNVVFDFTGEELTVNL